MWRMARWGVRLYTVRWTRDSREAPAGISPSRGTGTRGPGSSRKAPVRLTRNPPAVRRLAFPKFPETRSSARALLPIRAISALAEPDPDIPHLLVLRDVQEEGGDCLDHGRGGERPRIEGGQVRDTRDEAGHDLLCRRVVPADRDRMGEGGIEGLPGSGRDVVEGGADPRRGEEAPDELGRRSLGRRREEEVLLPPDGVHRGDDHLPPEAREGGEGRREVLEGDGQDHHLGPVHRLLVRNPGAGAGKPLFIEDEVAGVTRRAGPLHLPGAQDHLVDLGDPEGHPLPDIARPADDTDLHGFSTRGFTMASREEASVSPSTRRISFASFSMIRVGTT